jgi:hypothetical protein
MGYRSEVVLAISKKMVSHFMVTMAKEPAVRALVFEDSDRLDQDYDGDGGWLMNWTGIKWYDTFPEVAAIQAFVEDCDSECLETWDAELGEEDKNDPNKREYNHFRFVRLGEENEDVEEKGKFCYADICFVRNLNF